jgi:hypothetical protein
MIRLTPSTPAVTTITLAGSGNSTDGFVVKYNTSGTPQWATRIIGSLGTDAGNSISTDPNGNVYVTGQYASSPLTIYNSDTTTFGTLSNSGSDDAFVVKYNTSGTTQWATKISGFGSDLAWSISTDSNGNVYVTGSYTSTLTIYNSNGTTFGTLTVTNLNAEDVFVVKYNTSGTAQWATRIGGSGSDKGWAISTDPNGNVYVTGQYAANPVTIYNSDTTTFGTLTNSGSDDAFVVKYNTSGTAQWTTKIGGTGSEIARAISTDSDGNIYLTGQYASGPVTIYNSDTTTFGTLSNSGSNDVFIVKYNTSGTAQWATRLGGTGADVGYGIYSDSNGNVYVTGQYASSPVTIYNSDTTTFGTLSNSGSNDVFIVKYNTSGTTQWATRLGGSSSDSGYSITTDSNGNVYVTGPCGPNLVTIYNSDTTTFGTLTSAGLPDAFVVKYNTSGTAQWSKRIGGTSVDVGKSIITDSTGNVYFTGQFASSSITIN